MPIKINLLAEAQHAEDLRRRDPVKRGIWIGGFLVFLVLIYIAKLQLDVWQKQKEYKQIEQRWAALEPGYKKVLSDKKETEDLNGKLSVLDQLHTNRFLWGNVFNALQYTVVPNIQVTHMHGEQVYTHTDPSFKMVNDKRVTTPGSSLEKVTLTIDAKDTKPSDEGVANYTKYKDTLSHYDYFEQKLHSKDGFMIEGNISQPILDPIDTTKQFKTFSVVAHFPEIHHDE